MTERTNRDLIALAQKVLFPNYKPPPFVLAKGRGCRVWDVEGREFLDLAAGIAVLSLGHAHPKLAKAIADQAATLMHTSNLHYNEQSILFAAALTEKTGFSRAYFCNSGTEANEAMLKLARRYHHEKGDTGRKNFVSTIASFHGRTMGSLTLTGQPKYHVGMGPLVPGVSHVAYGDLEAMRVAINHETAAVIVEPIQAEGGIIVGTDAYLRGLRELCDQRGALLLFDEVQTGYGRTGKFLAREWSGVTPDACSLAKGIAGGFPLGAMVTTEKMAGGLPVGSHATTFGGNPLGAAAGLATLRIFEEEKVVENAARVGKYAEDKIRAMVSDPNIPAAAEFRGKGLLLGIKLAAGIDPAVALGAIRDRGVLLSLAGGDVLRISPALVVTEAEIDEGLKVIADALRELSRAIATASAGAP